MIRRPTAFNIDKIREAVQPSWAISNEKARQQLIWSPQFSLPERIGETVDWYLEHGWIKIRRVFAATQRDN